MDDQNMEYPNDWSKEVVGRENDSAEQSDTRNFLRLIYSLAGVGGWYLDVAQDRAVWTEEMFHIHGLEPGETPSFEESIRFYQGEDKEKHVAATKAAMEQGVPFAHELKLVTEKGVHKWVRSMAQPILENGKVVRIYGAVQDITDLHESLEALHANKADYKILLESAPFPILISRISDGTLRYGNRRAREKFGLAEEEGVGSSASSFYYSQEERNRFLLDLRQNGYAHDQELRLIDWNGEPYWALMSAAVVKYEGEPAILASINDITPLKDVEMELREERSLIDLMFSRISEGIVLVDAQSARFIRFNDAAHLLHGYTREEFSAMELKQIQNVLSTREIRDKLKNAEAGENISFETVHRHKDGRDIDLEVTLAKVRHGGRSLVCLTWKDITEQKEYRTHLEEMVLRRTVELDDARKAAEEANKAKSSFLSNMSHEIRTPINAIVGFAHLIRRDPLTQRQLDQLDKLSSSARHLLEIINDILDLSKIEADKIRLEAYDFEPARIVDHICSIVSNLAASKNLGLTVDLDHIPLMLQGDGVRLGQILLNLLSNSVKFTEKGGISIVARILEEGPEQVWLRFSVEDTGIGMTEEQMSRLFEDFVQADATTTRRFGGSGLGLSICRKLTKLMGGRISVESEIGRGSTFRVEIPFRKSEQLPQSISYLKSLSGMRVLIIDDNAYDRDILSEMLKEFGIRVDTTSGGKEGLNAMVKADQVGDGYKLLIIDLRMPQMDGIDTVLMMNSLKLDNTPKVLLSTAYGNQIQLDETSRAGVSKILPKPVTPSALYDSMVDVLEDDAKASYPKGDDFGLLEEELKKRSRARILLAEDNLINQEVTCQLIEIAGIRTAIAENGRMAVEMVRENDYDLVLMDVQMPVMDGLQATAEIRRLPGMGMLPIIAMTANAFEEDRRRCMEAGMNGHLAKPVEPEELYRMLLKWIPMDGDHMGKAGSAAPSGKVGKADASGEVGKAVPSGDLVERQFSLLEEVEGLDIQAGLKILRGDRKAYLRLLKMFSKMHGEDAKIISQCIAQGSLDKVKQAAHALKGVAGNLGAYRIGELASGMEKAVSEETGSPAGAGSDGVALLNRQASLLDLELGKVMKAINRAGALDTAGVEGWLLQQEARDTSMDAAKDVLEKLEALLSDSDTEANDVFESAGELLVQALGEAAHQIGKAIEDFDYKDALVILREKMGKS